MSDTDNHVSLELSPEEQVAVEALQQEMGLESPDDVVHMLLRQAYQRVAVVCPTCGHSARKTTEDEAKCVECMSVLHLSDGIWEVIHLQ
jgi:hypothetical protein